MFKNADDPEVIINCEDNFCSQICETNFDRDTDNIKLATCVK